MEIETIMTFKVGGEPGERRALEMLTRWHGPDVLNERDSKGRLAHPGTRALNTLLDRSEITNRMLPGLVDYLRVLDEWAHAEIDLYGSLADGGNSMAWVVVESRRECLDDIVEFGQYVMAPMLAACSALAEAKVIANA